MNRTYRLARRLVWVTAAFVAVVGCSPASLSYFLFKGDGTAPPDYPFKAPSGRKEISVAVLMSAPNAPTEFAGVERDLSRRLGQVLADQTKEKRNPIRPVDQSQVDRFKMTTAGWRTLPPAEIGRQLGADFVIDATVTNLSLYEAGYGRHMYQGQGTVEAVVYETATGKEHCRYFINPKLDARPAESLPPGQYRSMLVQRIADELSWKHLPHITDRRVAPVQ